MSDACERCHSPLSRGDLRCATCGMPTPAEFGRVEATAAKILRCHGCGAAVAYDVDVQAPRCSFCRSVMELEQPEDPIEQAEQYLSFKVDDTTARQALKAWLGRGGFFRPSDLQKSAAVDSLKPLWWVGWLFDARVHVSWAADSNAGARRSAWAPHAGEMHLDLRNVVVPASRGLTSGECTGLVSNYDLSAVAPEPVGRPGATVEQFAVQRSGARRAVAGGLAGVARSHAKQAVPGSSVRNLHVAVLPEQLTTRRFAFPAYVLAYRYRDQLYRAIVHGQDPRCVLGKAPLSWARIVLVAAGVAVILVIIVLVVTGGVL